MELKSILNWKRFSRTLSPKEFEMGHSVTLLLRQRIWLFIKTRHLISIF